MSSIYQANPPMNNNYQPVKIQNTKIQSRWRASRHTLERNQHLEEENHTGCISYFLQLFVDRLLVQAVQVTTQIETWSLTDWLRAIFQDIHSNRKVREKMLKEETVNFAYKLKPHIWVCILCMCGQTLIRLVNPKYTEQGFHLLPNPWFFSSPTVNQLFFNRIIT